LSRVVVSFDETNLVSNAGLLPAAALAQRIDLGGLIDSRLGLAKHGANSGAKALSVIGSMLVGGDSIDDVAVLRAGGSGQLFDSVRAPSTVGSWLRAHKWSNVRQLDAVSRELLARLWAAGAGPADLAGPLTIDLDSTIVAVHGRAKQGAAFGYTGVRLYEGARLPPAARDLRADPARVDVPAARWVRRRRPGRQVVPDRDHQPGPQRRRQRAAHRPSGQRLYSKAVLHTAAAFDVRFSITVRQDKRIRAAIQTIDEQAWQPIPYWLSSPEVSGADVAEITYTAFTGTHALPVRLIVRRVRPTPGSQLALFTTWSYHAFVTDRPGQMLELEADHRRHAIVEQTIAELKSAGLAHLPSGHFMANAAWLALAVMAHNLGRAGGHLAGLDLTRATIATLQRKVFTLPGRLIHTGRRRHLRLPAHWPWAEAINTALQTLTTIPLRY
jgi:hypothetical protein